MTTNPVVELVAGLDYPMFIVTAYDGRERSGCLIGFATQCSIHPPRFIVCISVRNHTFRVLGNGVEVVVVHLVPADAEDLAELFGSQTGDDVDKFSRTAWREGPAGAPVLERCENWFAGRILQCIPAGDHFAYLLAPIAAHSGGRERGFTFHRARVMELEPGHEA
jgi:flavin reductase (DIM6/NTAB) family NADH-FMN oxidoreductase RutF